MGASAVTERARTVEVYVANTEMKVVVLARRRARATCLTCTATRPEARHR